jgi:Fuc2NAc and GlcNAc transferase
LLSILLLLLGVWWINLFDFMDGIAASQAVFMSLIAAGLTVW